MTDDQRAIDSRIQQLNQRLKLARLGVQIERRSQKLSLRGTFPPRPGSDRLRPYQQRVPLGLPATSAGLKQAEQEAKIVAAQLLQKSFDWRNYHCGTGGLRLNQLELEQQLRAFEQDFFTQRDRRSRSAATTSTWNTAYAPYLRKLRTVVAANPQMTMAEAMHKTIHTTAEDSRSRQICCTALAALARFLDLDLPFDLKTFWGSYGPNAVEHRDLPSDDVIVATFEQIPHPEWRFVYGMMATYGLRNHEVFFCDYSALQQGNPNASIRVLPMTKTGSHEVWPFYPEWVDRFNLRDIQLPDVETDLKRTTLQRVGQHVTVQFRRYNIPFNPYSLRHAWAVRTIHFGLPDTVAARMMGHSVAVHTRTYHQWMTHRDQQMAVEAALQRSRLKSPESPMIEPALIEGEGDSKGE
ncbi:integrase [Leptolyngbya sp. 'hensonii']|uniref:site-specific integrase n=1 Tax=Leptolyngbya sp. 'hensonii' TaxID=1922337 RepID=UPI00094FFC2D|nr:site-specific integrase [Leptolyngbya sp. 'hensonii']OLP19576.1 integrase [Leptolyngbya sp. 'hensonii']